jgi:FkbM family methyltransferase
MSALKRELARRWPRAAAAYHAFRQPSIAAGTAGSRTPDGFLFAGPEAMRSGRFEPEETAVVRRLAGDYRVFIDVGANVGYFTCLARSLGYRVVALEPSAQNLDVLYGNLLMNGWRDVEVLPVGAGAEPGLATLYGSGTGASLITRWAGTSEVTARIIPLSTLDGVLAGRFAGERLLIKIDVEGAEYAVLKGADAMLARRPRPTWLVEICLTENHPAGVNPHFATVFEIFRRAGYMARSVDAPDREITADLVDRWVAARSRDFGYVSYLFTDPVETPP